MYNEAKKKSNEKYLSKFKPITLRFEKEPLAEMQAAAAAAGLSMQKYIMGAVEARMSGKYDKEPEPVQDDSMLTPAARQIAIEAAGEAGKDVSAWILNAVTMQRNCERGAKDLEAQVAEKRAKEAAKLQPKEETPPVVQDYDFHGHAAHNFELWKQHNYDTKLSSVKK